MVTNVAITLIKIGILILEGTNFLISETIKLEETNTKITAAPIPMALFTEDETARVGQSPSIIRKMGLLL